MMSTSDLLAGFPLQLEIALAWGEMDAFGHVNNAVYFRYFESARIAYFEAIGWTAHMAESGVGPILASTSCRFKQPLCYPDRLQVGARVTEVKSDRFSMTYRLVSESLASVAAEGQGLVVSYDYGAGSKAPIPDLIEAELLRFDPGAVKL